MKHPETCTVEVAEWLKAFGDALLRAGEEADTERRARQLEGRERGRALIAEARARRASGATWKELSADVGETVPVLKRLLGAD